MVPFIASSSSRHQKNFNSETFLKNCGGIYCFHIYPFHNYHIHCHPISSRVENVVFIVILDLSLIDVSAVFIVVGFKTSCWQYNMVVVAFTSSSIYGFILVVSIVMVFVSSQLRVTS